MRGIGGTLGLVFGGESLRYGVDKNTAFMRFRKAALGFVYLAVKRPLCAYCGIGKNTAVKVFFELSLEVAKQISVKLDVLLCVRFVIGITLALHPAKSSDLRSIASAFKLCKTFVQQLHKLVIAPACAYLLACKYRRYDIGLLIGEGVLIVPSAA